MRWLLLLLATGMFGFGSVSAQEKKKTDPAFDPVTDDPKLPRVLLIGDSISIGYTAPTRKLLEGKANVHRIPENGGPTINGLKNLKSYNATAKKIMDKNGVAINDLYAFALPRLKTFQLKVNVHFTPEGSAALAQRVAAAIEAKLPK